MTRRTILSMLVALIALVFTSAGGASVAQAQCCTFTVDVNCNLSPACFPIAIKTNWQQGGINASQGNTVGVCGATTFPITAVPCPPQPVLNVYAINGSPAIPFGNPPVRVALVPGGCCVWTWATFDLAGCPIIYIVPC